MSERVEVYTTVSCGYCVRAKQLLSRLNIPYREVDVTRDHDKRDWLVSTTGRRTVPKIFIDGRSIGGYTELAALERAGGLAGLLPG